MTLRVLNRYNSGKTGVFLYKGDWMIYSYDMSNPIAGFATKEDAEIVLDAIDQATDNVRDNCWSSDRD